MLKKYVSTVLGYLGVGFISGSISHGFYSGTRSIIMALIGIILFIIHQYLEDQTKDQPLWIIVYGLLFSVTIGMISGGFQHFLDSPLRSVWIIPMGFFFSYLLFTHHHKDLSRQNTVTVSFAGTSLLLILGYTLYVFAPQSWFASSVDHHAPVNTMMPYDCATTPGGCQHFMNNKKDVSKKSNTSTSHDHAAMVISEEEFIRLMIPHHQEAVDTSALYAVGAGKGACDPAIEKIATSIYTAQIKEISMMEKRLTDWYPNGSAKGHYMPMMRSTQNQGAMGEGGTRMQIDACKEYVQDMILHHQGAVQMAEKVLTLSPREEVKKFANDVITLQNSEIEEMRMILKNNSWEDISLKDATSSTSNSSSSMMDHSMHMGH